jgi:hypothetical protein
VKLHIKFPSVGQILTTTFPALLVLLMIFPFMSFFNLKMRWLIKDTADIAKVNPLTGYLSNMGMLMWCATIAITLFTAILIYRKTSLRKFWFYLSTSLFTFILLMDDLFMFHEELAPQYLGFGEHAVYLFYIVCAIAYVIFFRKEILETHFIGLFIALGFMAVSIGCDYLQNLWLWKLGQWEYFLEEGLKWFGLAWWCSYFAESSFETVTAMLKPAPAG